jgi:hypothetical protein
MYGLILLWRTHTHHYHLEYYRWHQQYKEPHKSHPIIIRYVKHSIGETTKNILIYPNRKTEKAEKLLKIPLLLDT